MFGEITTQTVEWLSSTGAPNGVVVVTLLTHPAMWSEKAREVVSSGIDRYVPGSGESTADDAGGGA